MPHAGRAWWHLILTTKGSWLPGDPRGFRDHNHRLHSSGDYRHLPPTGEHAGLLRHNQRLAAAAVILSPAARELIGSALRSKLQLDACRTLALTVAPTHAHLLVELAGDYLAVRQYMGHLKRTSSHAVRQVLPGTVWAKSGRPIQIKDRAHQLQVFQYICAHAQKERAWVWTFRDHNQEA